MSAVGALQKALAQETDNTWLRGVIQELEIVLGLSQNAQIDSHSAIPDGKHL